MNEVGNALKRMAVYYLLLAINIIPCALIPDIFPLRNASSVYLLLLSVCLVLYYTHRVSPSGRLSGMMKALSWMCLLLILLRAIKYSAFSEVGVLARHTWYLYYVPMLLLPLFLLYTSLLVTPQKNARISGLLYGALALTAALIALVLTNDLHQLVFRFRPGFTGWDADYSRGWSFYAVMVWQYALYLAAIVILTVKCRIMSARRSAWIILIPAAIGITLNVLLMTGKMPSLSGTHLVEFPEALIFTVAAVLECCMQLGLIPTNTDYGRLFPHFSISAQITDGNGAPVYSSFSAIPLTPEQFASESGLRIGEHTVLHKMQIPGGFGFWQDDMTALDHLNGELAETKEALAQEAELFRLRNELKERQAKIRQRTLVYDNIARRTQKQSQTISHLAEAARLSQDEPFRQQCRSRITMLGAYIKRYANLMLLSQELSVIESGELGLSVSEVLRYLNLCGIPSECFLSADCSVPGAAALKVFEAFGELVEQNVSCLQGVFVNISAPENVTVKLTFENLSVPLSRDTEEELLSVGVSCDVQCEDNVTYHCLTLPKAGDAL